MRNPTSHPCAALPNRMSPTHTRVTPSQRSADVRGREDTLSMLGPYLEGLTSIPTVGLETFLR